MDSLRDIKEKRVKSLVYIARQLIIIGKINRETYTLNADVVSTLVEHYVQDLINLKSRYGISGKANPAKVAGLMAGAIMRYLPVLPLNGRDGVGNYDCNELLAVYHGLALCAMQSNGTVKANELKTFIQSLLFPEWLDRFKYLLKNRNHTPESLAFVFDTVGTFALDGVTSEPAGD